MKTKITYSFLLIFGTIASVFGQYPWIQTNIISAPRYEDVFFLNKDTGFAASNDSYIFKTIDGGQHWDSVYHGHQYLRSIEFSSYKRGFCGGLLSSGNAIFMKTLDGGNTWADISNLITVSNKGVCGICSIDTNITYAVGVFSSPAFVIKTTDGGLNWLQTNMSAYASRLVDVKFLNKDTGYVVGTSNIIAEGGVIIKTTDGGLTWNKIFVTNTSGDYVWKIQNLDNINWFCSVQRTNINGPNQIIKSTDGGNNWGLKTVSYSADHLQMVGFINPNKGWAGFGNLFETTDGGNTWLQINGSQNSFNRFFRLDSNLAYIGGNYVYKFNDLANGIKENKTTELKFLEIKISPNPSSNPVSISIKSSKRSCYNLRVFGSEGKNIIYYCDGILERENTNIAFDHYFTKGVYYVSVIVNEGIVTKKLIIE